MVGPLVAERMRVLGLNQTSLSELSNKELRQNYISQVVRGEIAVPLGRKAELLREYLKISREDWYRAAGMLEEDDVETPGKPVPVQLTLSDPDESFDPDAIVGYVESRPGQRFQDQLQALRKSASREDYARFCVGLFRAWASNSELALTALHLREQGR